jgi:hypothetical protein
MELHELDDLIFGLGIDPSHVQLNELYLEFKRDFIDNVLTIEGLNVKVILKNSNVEGFETYPETFVHLITRKSTGGKRVFDRHRANKIHWIRCILEKKDEENILCFRYPEDDGTIRDYYWYQEGDFLVIMEKILPDYLIITCFHIDDKRTRDFFEKKLKWHEKNWQ